MVNFRDCRLREFMPPSNRTNADDLVVAVVLTLALFEIARVLLRLITLPDSS